MSEMSAVERLQVEIEDLEAAYGQAENDCDEARKRGCALVMDVLQLAYDHIQECDGAAAAVWLQFLVKTEGDTLVQMSLNSDPQLVVIAGIAHEAKAILADAIAEVTR